MLLSLSLIILTGLAAGWLCKKLHLPSIIGMLAAGIILGPYCLDVLDETILGISPELRQIALIIILIKAGLSLDPGDLMRVGRPAFMMTFVPATCEIIGYTCLAPLLFGISHVEAALMGAVLSAVSPAVVVPRMVDLMEKGQGTEKSIPQMILAGASCDDIYVIVLFSAFLTMAGGGSMDISAFADIPVSVITGLLAGTVTGFILSTVFEKAFERGNHVRNSVKITVLMGVAFFLMSMEDMLEGRMAFSGLLAVVAAASVLKIRSTSFVSGRLAEKMGKLWIAAEIMLFVLVGAAVDIRYALDTGIPAVIMILTALCARTAGVLLCTAGTALNAKERLFCAVAYIPKATVQAAIGSVPLAAGLPCGRIILSVAVLGIIITAPAGAVGIDLLKDRCLEKNSGKDGTYE